MTYDILATGSTGNAVIINGNILIDCGVPYKTIRPYAKDLRLVLLTHVHSDHFNPATVRTLHRERPALRWGCCEWMVGPLLEAGVDKKQIDVLFPGDTYCYFRLGSVTLELLTHNVSNCGYHIWIGMERLFYATDTGTLDGIVVKNYDYYLIEANHTKADIEARIAAKIEAGEFSYELDAMRNHLSEEQAIAWLAENAGPNSRYQFLHQHSNKNKEAIK